MVDLLLYSSLLCEDADAIMLRIKQNEDMNSIVKVELIDTIQEATPNCPWDAND
jgi:ferredoxin